MPDAGSPAAVCRRAARPGMRWIALHIPPHRDPRTQRPSCTADADNRSMRGDPSRAPPRKGLIGATRRASLRPRRKLSRRSAALAAADRPAMATLVTPIRGCDAMMGIFGPPAHGYPTWAPLRRCHASGCVCAASLVDFSQHRDRPDPGRGATACAALQRRADGTAWAGPGPDPSRPPRPHARAAAVEAERERRPAGGRPRLPVADGARRDPHHPRGRVAARQLPPHRGTGAACAPASAQGLRSTTIACSRSSAAWRCWASAVCR